MTINYVHYQHFKTKLHEKLNAYEQNRVNNDVSTNGNHNKTQ